MECLMMGFEKLQLLNVHSVISYLFSVYCKDILHVIVKSLNGNVVNKCERMSEETCEFIAELCNNVLAQLA